MRQVGSGNGTLIPGCPAAVLRLPSGSFAFADPSPDCCY